MKRELNPENFVLVLTVGGSPEPLIYSISQYKPYYVVFIPSEDTLDKISMIMDAENVKGIVKKSQTITLDHPENLVDCVRDIRTKLPVALKKMKLSRNILIIADNTGGTKVMSSALTLAMMEFNSSFTYVGGTKRGSDGTGKVETGSEKIIDTFNPWDEIGVREAHDLVFAFNTGHYPVAREKAEYLQNTDYEYRGFYDGLIYIIDAMSNWNIFNYKSAVRLFHDGLYRLKNYNNRNHGEFQKLYKKLEINYEDLEKIAKDAESLQDKETRYFPESGMFFLRDLVANARRCAGQGHYDDAVARLYSAIEKKAKIALAQKGVNNSKITKEELNKLSEALIMKYSSQTENETYKLPLEDSYQALCDLAPEDPLSLSYKKHKDALKKALESRNMSLLAHGYIPVKEEAYLRLNKIALEFLDIREEDLPEFPKLEQKAILF